MVMNHTVILFKCAEQFMSCWFLGLAAAAKETLTGMVSG